MSEIQQLRRRVNNSGVDGVLTAHVRDDYDPAGDLMISQLVDSGEFVTRRTPANSLQSKWRIFKSGNEPY